jgi:hypothetical protein
VTGRTDGARRALRPLPAWIALWTSVGAHAQLLWLGAWLGGNPIAGGEAGDRGAGGDTIEITVVRGEQRPGASAPPPEEPRPAAPEEAPRPAAAPAPVITARRAPRERAREATPQDTAAPSTPTEEPRAAEQTAPDTAQAGASGDADRASQGRAEGADVAAVILGSVGIGAASSEHSRALLEQALACDDPIEGVWVAHRYSPEFHDWARMTLRIERDGEQLRGTIISRSWSGRASDRRPPPCAPGAHDMTVRMEAHGTLRGDRMVFGADTHELLRADCPSTFFSYNPDRFSGTVDPVREEIAAVNNDGGRDVDAPYRFRRTSCLQH